jgi:two-component system, NtrC family, sensor histidine kinase PilS
MASSGKNSTLSYNDIARPVLWALSVVVVIFISYEVIERFWLSEVDSSRLHQLHILRGLFSSVVAAVLVGWLIVKSSPSLFPASPASEAMEQIERPTQLERLHNFNRWFILMRWIAVFVAWVLTFFVVQVAEWLPQDVWWPLVSTIIVLAVLNLVYEYLFHKRKFQKYLLQFQAYSDLVILAFLLHFSGGIENPLSLLMLFHVIIAGIILTRKHCYSVAATASILLAIIAAGEATGLLNHYTLTLFPHAMHEGELAHASHQSYYVISYVVLLSSIFFLTAHFITTLADRLRREELQLEKFADHAHEQRQLIEKALETTNTGLCVCFSDGQPYWTNLRWNEWFGHESLHTYLDKNQLCQSLSACKVVKAGKTHSCEFDVPEDGTPGENRTYRITTAPLYSTEGQMNHAVSLAQDISEQKKVQEQMIRAGKLAAVGELAGHVAHEVNNPIGIISAKTRLLLSNHANEMSPKVQQELEKITMAADRVARIAKGLLFYCRPSTAKRSNIDISAPIREALTMIEQRAGQSGVKIDVQLPNRLPAIYANAGEMQQVFLNLFLNALDVMSCGGILRIRAFTTINTENGMGSSLILTVQDTGPGIPDEIKDHIFEPFFTTKDEEKGSGLGLSICDGLIRSHGGTIKFVSENGHGTRFKICLPITT